MKLSTYKIILLFTLVLSLSDCTTTVIPLEEVTPILELVTYEKDVKTIMESHCTNCHINGGQASFLPLVNYTQVRNSAEFGNLIQRMNSTTNPMPSSGRLSAAILALIDKWEADGFLEN